MTKASKVKAKTVPQVADTATQLIPLYDHIQSVYDCVAGIHTGNPVEQMEAHLERTIPLIVADQAAGKFDTEMEGDSLEEYVREEYKKLMS